MFNNFNLRGLADWIRLGKRGPVIKKASDSRISMLAADGTTLINVEGADPILDQDFVTKLYHDSNSSAIPPNHGATRYKDHVAGAGATIALGAILPDNALVYGISIEVKVAYSDNASVVSIGTSGTNDLLMSFDKSDLKQDGEDFMVDISEYFTTGEQINIYSNLNAEADSGRIGVLLHYTIIDAQAPIVSSMYSHDYLASNIDGVNETITTTNVTAVFNLGVGLNLSKTLVTGVGFNDTNIVHSNNAAIFNPLAVETSNIQIDITYNGTQSAASDILIRAYATGTSGFETTAAVSIKTNLDGSDKVLTLILDATALPDLGAITVQMQNPSTQNGDDYSIDIKKIEMTQL